MESIVKQDPPEMEKRTHRDLRIDYDSTILRFYDSTILRFYDSKWQKTTQLKFLAR